MPYEDMRDCRWCNSPELPPALVLPLALALPLALVDPATTREKHDGGGGEGATHVFENSVH